MFNKFPSIQAPELNETSDGCPGEYHNAIYLAWFVFKVRIGWFTKVNHFFLSPGHLHDLQDQRWQLLKSTFYKANEVFTWNQFIEICKQCLSSTPIEVITDIFIFDWKAWFKPWVCIISNHSKWRAFNFTIHPTKPDVVVMK